MSLQGPTQTQQKQETRDVNPALQPFLTDVLGQAQGLYKSGAGTSPYTGLTVAPLDPLAQAGISGIAGTASQMEGNAGVPYSSALGAINSGGVSSQMQPYLGDLSTVAGNTSPTASSQYLTSLANPGTTINPYLQSLLDAQNALISNRINSQISGAGRYGSGGQADVLGRSLGAADAPVIAQAFENQQNRAISAASQIDAAQRALEASRTGASSAALNPLVAAGNTALGWAGLTPTLNSLAYDPSNRLLGLGGMLTDRSQQELTNQIAMRNAENVLPWTQLGRYVGAISGALPGFAGTGTTQGTTTTQNQVPWWSLLSGGQNSVATGGANVGAGTANFLGNLIPKIGSLLPGA